MYGFDTTFHYSNYDYYGTDYDSRDSVHKYSDTFLYNILLSIRAGRPYAGFRARVAWPLPFAINVNKPQNYFLEYSAYGFFGSPAYKIGFGVNGFLKTWGHTFLQEDSYYMYDENPNPPESREFQAVVPGTKIAFLIRKHNVLTISADLGGIIIPRFGANWDPELGLSYVFSFGELRDPSSLDGKF